MHRREFLSLLGRAVPAATVLSATTGAYAVGVEPKWIDVRRVRVPVAGLAPALAGLRVVQISDIHRSEAVGGAFVREAVETAIELRPELVALTGDFITNDVAALKPLAAELAPLGAAAPCFAVPGNHDYVHLYPWARPRDPDGADRLADTLDRAGIQLMRNERRFVRPRAAEDLVELVGLDDWWSPCFDADCAFDGIGCDPGRPPRIVLSHNPDSFREVHERPFELMLCGHTHGGQVRLPLLGVPVVPIEDRRFIAGMVPADGRLVYVNRGLGFSRRIRFGVRPEITLLELVAA